MKKDLKQANSQRNLNFLKKRHSLSGFDSDYVDKLGDAESAWLERFSRNYYDGLRAGQSEDHFKEANRRRYRSKVTDAMTKIGFSLEDVDSESIDNLDPEKILLMFEVVGTKYKTG